MQQRIIIVTRGINCISMELKQIALKYCFKFDFNGKAIYYNPLLEIKKMYAMQACCRRSFSETCTGPTSEW